LKIIDPTIPHNPCDHANPMIHSFKEKKGERYLLRCIKDISSSNGTLVHEVVDHWQFRETDDLEWCLDETAAEEFDGFGGVAAVADIRAFDGDHFDNGLEDGCAEVGAGWETDADDGAAWSDVLVVC